MTTFNDRAAWKDTHLAIYATMSCPADHRARPRWEHQQSGDALNLIAGFESGLCHL